MATTPFTIEQFSGLNLAADPLEVGASGATDLLNVELDTLGRVRTRPGTTKLNTSTPSATSYLALEGITDGTTTIFPRLLAISRDASQDMVVNVIQSNGTATDPVGGVLADTGSWDVGSIVRIGTDTIFYAFITRWEAGTGHALSYLNLNTALSYSLTSIAAKPWLGAAWSTQSRLVIAGFNAVADGPGGANGSVSTVWFSDPGAPTTFSASSWIKLNPGDGEQITAIAEYDEFMIVLKQRSAYVFSGVDTGSDGEPVFNYRRVGLPDSIVPRNGTYRPAAVGTPYGVFYATRKGVYVMQGGPSTCVSDPIAPIFQSEDNVIPSASESTDTRPALSWAGGRLFVRYSVAAGERVLVFDPRTKNWTIWAIPLQTGRTMTEFPPDVNTTNVIYTTSLNDVIAVTRAAADDQGTPIAWTWTSGKYSLGDPARETITLESSATGSGTVTMAVTTDQYGTLTGTATALGTAPSTSEGFLFADQEGTTWSHTLSGSGQALVSRLTHFISFVRPSGVR